MFPMTMIPGGTRTLACTSAGATHVALGGTSASVSQGAQILRQYIVTSDPASTNVAFIRFGATDAVADVAVDHPILPGTVQTFTSSDLFLTGRTVTGTATLYVTAGYGE